MAGLKQFLDRFGGCGDAEAQWLQKLFVFVRDHVCPDSAPSVCGLSLELVRVLKENSPSGTLPLSYSLVSVSELLSQQRVPCVSCLTWSTNQHRAWMRDSELIAGLRPLPRVKLLLIGSLGRERGPDLSLKDATGEVACQSQVPLQSGSLDTPVFLPHWNYIPHNTPGLLELVAPPLLLCPAPPQQPLDSVTEGVGHLTVYQAAALLFRHQNSGRAPDGSGRGLCRGGRVSVSGLVSAVCPLLDISGTSFFIFCLTQNQTSVNVIVKDSLWWSRSMHVDMRVHVTQLRVCTLRSRRGVRVLSSTDQSQLCVQTEDQLESRVQSQDQSQLCVQTEDQSEGRVQSQDQSQPASKDTQPQNQPFDQSGLRRSTVINYKGTVTEVLSRGAGLYVIDSKVGLCLANQPLPTRRIRPGDVVQVSNVHVLRRPSPDHAPIMLCCCLRSGVTITAFSPGYRSDEEEEEPCPGDGVLPRILLQKEVDVAEYLWMCHVTERLRNSLSPQGQCLCLVSWSILQSLTTNRTSRRRDIYGEMMDTPHHCPVTTYGSASSLPHVLSLESLHAGLLARCWSSLSLRSLLPSDGQSMNCSQLNAALSWSQVSQRSQNPDPKLDPRPDQGERPLVVVGLLQLPSPESEALSLVLQDATMAVPCVVTEGRLHQGPGQGPGQGPDQDRREQTAFFSSAWIGCLVCVRHFTMVTERFIQSDFPSFNHLEQEHFISQKQARVYLQFSLDQVTVLSPSDSMAALQEAESEEPDVKKRKTDCSQGGGVTGCVSVVIRAEQKQGVAYRNVGAGSTLSFNLRAAVIGPVVSWGRDPKNRPITEREMTTTGEKTNMSLSFSGASSRWFPLLQDDCYYRLVAPGTQDPSVLIGCTVAGQTGVELHADSALQVLSDWRIHTVPRPLNEAPESCDLGSLSNVISSTSALVSFTALVSDRVGVSDRSKTSQTGARLTVCDDGGRSLHVYLDTGHAPFIPGLLPGNRLRFSRLQRKVSRAGSVYCCWLPVSSVCIVSTQSQSAAPPQFPMMLLGLWMQEGGVSVARVRGQLVCVLFLQLQWSCSLCERRFTTNCSGPQCTSSSAVFQAKAKVVLEDGSAEAHVFFYNALVQTVLRLDDSQWAGLQRAVKVKGHIQVTPRGRGLSVTGPDQLLLQLLLSLSAEVLFGSVTLTCRRQRSSRPGDLRRVVRGDRDFMTRVTPPLQLTCDYLERS
ncbi:unnamed protein product [Knipowitschia caucasica]